MSFQDHFPGNTCYGCGPASKYGMHVTKSFWVTSDHLETMCDWKIKQKYKSAASGLHGGTSASLVDCHSIWTAIAARYDLEKRPFGDDPIICYVTAEMLIKYLKPVPMDSINLSIISRVEELKETSRACKLETWIVAKGIICVTAKVIAVRVELSEAVIHGLVNPPQLCLSIPRLV